MAEAFVEFRAERHGVDSADQDTQFIAVGETKGAYFRLVGSERTILGVVAPIAGDVWFIKLAGDNELAEREREHFEQFVKSIHLNGAEGADDGQ